MTSVEMGPQHFGQGKYILAVRDRGQDTVFHPFTVGQHPFLAATRAEASGLAREGQEIVMAAPVTVNPGKALVQVATIQETLQGPLLHRPMDATRRLQLLPVAPHATVQWAVVGVPRTVDGTLLCSAGFHVEDPICLHDWLTVAEGCENVYFVPLRESPT